jgi:hypothetical protein
MNWMLFILCVFAVIGATFTLGLLALVALCLFDVDKK